MNNWDYANDIPTSPWRGAQALPRELKLQTINGKVQLTQNPVQAADDLAGKTSFTLKKTTLAQGTTDLGPQAAGQAYRLDVTLDAKTAATAGVNVRTGAGSGTVIGYDAKSQQLFVDRTHSGNVAFNPAFPSIERASVMAKNGKISLHIYVDWSSVEVFTDDGTLAMTEQIFPDPSNTGVQLFSTGGDAVVDSLKITPIASVWNQKNGK
jgi:fructan beta-fructosidase